MVEMYSVVSPEMDVDDVEGAELGGVLVTP